MHSSVNFHKVYAYKQLIKKQNVTITPETNLCSSSHGPQG